MIRYANELDIPGIKEIADSHKKELGFTNIAIIRDAQQHNQIIIIEQDNILVGFIRFRLRKDDVAVIYEIVVGPKRTGYGSQLIHHFIRIAGESNKQYIRLKCPIELAANSFYKKMRFHLIGSEVGKKRELNIWQYVINPS